MDKQKNALNTWAYKFQTAIKSLNIEIYNTSPDTKNYKTYQALNSHYLAMKLLFIKFHTIC